MTNDLRKPNGQQYTFAKPYIKRVLQLPDLAKYEEGQTLYECADGWFQIKPDTPKYLRFAPAQIRQLLFMGHLVELG